MSKDLKEVVALAIVVAAIVCLIRINAAMPSETPYKPAPVVQAAPAPPAHTAKALKQPKPRKKTKAEIAADAAYAERQQANAACKQLTLMAAQLGRITPEEYVDSCK